MGRHANILLVDDDLSVRQALGEALAVENYHVALAATGPEAVRHLEERGEHEIDAVLLDLRLGPEDGWNLFSRLTRMQPGLPVIIMTGTRGEQVPVSATDCVALLEKPLDLRQLFETLRDVTAERERTQQRIGSSPLEAQHRPAA